MSYVRSHAAYLCNTLSVINKSLYDMNKKEAQTSALDKYTLLPQIVTNILGKKIYDTTD